MDADGFHGSWLRARDSASVGVGWNWTTGVIGDRDVERMRHPHVLGGGWCADGSWITEGVGARMDHGRKDRRELAPVSGGGGETGLFYHATPLFS